MGIIIDFDCKFRVKPRFKEYIIEKIYEKTIVDDYDFEIGNVPFQYRSLLRARQDLSLKEMGTWVLDNTTNIAQVFMHVNYKDFEYCPQDELEEFVREIIVPISSKIFHCEIYIPNDFGGSDKTITFEDYELRGCTKFSLGKMIESIKHNLNDNSDIISSTIIYKKPLHIDYTDDIEEHFRD